MDFKSYLVHIDSHGSPLCGAVSEGAMTVDEEHERKATCSRCIVMFHLDASHVTFNSRKNVQ